MGHLKYYMCLCWSFWREGLYGCIFR